LTSHYQPDMTPSEREFVREVREMDFHVNGAGGYGYRIEWLEEKVKGMLAAADAKKASKNAQSSPTQKLSPAALDKIKQELEQKNNGIQDTNERILDLQERLDDLGIDDNSQ
ncbi:hypothetical protein GGI19_007052, partial [Coemansia pectinata]